MSSSIPLSFASEVKAAFRAAHKSADVAVHLRIDGAKCVLADKTRHRGDAAAAVAALAGRVGDADASVHLIPSGCGASVGAEPLPR